MNVEERLGMAVDPRTSGERFDAEAFLARVLPTLGIAYRPDAQVADPNGVGPGHGGGEEDTRELCDPPTREELLDELHGLIRVARDEEIGGVYRRIAEIIEVIDEEEAAHAWWLHAAEAGDEVAVATVEHLPRHRNHEERPSALQLIEVLSRRLYML
ncbi:hypothetical protein ACFWIB_30815 [Streptomyces sp. NPDC127051]|uniref:hypothetical protein n=1 Tax=Streptomyces sp. NPDC127051 TaxID=3347119 RepID=UPI00365B02C1